MYDVIDGGCTYLRDHDLAFAIGIARRMVGGTATVAHEDGTIVWAPGMTLAEAEAYAPREQETVSSEA